MNGICIKGSVFLFLAFILIFAFTWPNDALGKPKLPLCNRPVNGGEVQSMQNTADRRDGTDFSNPDGNTVEYSHIV